MASSFTSKLAIEDQVALSRALLQRHINTVECHSTFGCKFSIQLLAQTKPHGVFDLIERMTSSVLMRNMEVCTALLMIGGGTSSTSDHQDLLINLGCAIEYQSAQDKSIKFTAESGSIVLVPPKTSMLSSVLPNTCPTALGHIPQGCSILVSLCTADSNLSDSELLRYNQRLQKGIQHASKHIVTQLSSKDKLTVLRGLWPQLPAEISYYIIKQLDVKGLMRFACTSKGTQTLVYSDNQLWQAADVTRSYSKELKLATSNRRLIQREMRNKGKDGNENVMALVVALGSHHIDAGMAGDDIPDIVVPSLVCQVKSFGEQPQLFAGHEATLIPSGTKILPIQKKQIINTKYLLHLIEQVYVSHPCADFEYQPLLLSFSARNMVSDYDELMYECLQRFNIPVIAAVESETLALYTHGQTDGIVVDVGYECTTIVPVEEGFAIRANMIVIPVGGRHVTLELLNRIRAQYPALSDLTEEEANEIKEKYCYFKTNSPYAAVYEGDREVLIRGEYYHLGEALYESCNVLFNPFEFGTGTRDFKEQYSYMIESLEHNYPKPKVRNTVVLVGATTLLPGYVHRFKEVVEDLYIKFPSWKLTAFAYRGFAEWIGGSILGSLTCQQNFWLTKEQLKARLDG